MSVTADHHDRDLSIHDLHEAVDTTHWQDDRYTQLRVDHAAYRAHASGVPLSRIAGICGQPTPEVRGRIIRGQQLIEGLMA